MKDTIFATLNTRGCSVGLRRSQVLSFLREGGYSVIFLQETHTAPAVEASWWLESGDEVYFSHLGARSAAVATLFSPKLRPEVLGVAEVVPGRLLHVRACVEGLRLNLVSVYAPNAGPEQVRFYRQASAFLGTLDPHECLVLGGDFNTTLEERDRSGVETSQAAVGVLREIVDHHSLVDIWCDHHPDDDVTFTYVRVEGDRSCHSRLYRIYISRFHLARAYASGIRPAPFSDHHLVTVTASLSPGGPSSPERFCSIPHPPPSGDGSQLLLLLCPGEKEGGQKAHHLAPGRGWDPPHGSGGDAWKGQGLVH
ncbi:unnamed protein product [Caretta caretta]